MTHPSPLSTTASGFRSDGEDRGESKDSSFRHLGCQTSPEEGLWSLWRALAIGVHTVQPEAGKGFELVARMLGVNRRSGRQSDVHVSVTRN
eukprot:CAMPEP_0204564794 /NCGR_PEP_ID=MMETSP0661-20131031/35102_1 /ASSEMBLY_ACC=CAM_ASM_000606 /TAXON_ID=109239 /ORGANISM="Alexandrium margalefi, Strain AMGDE01CS-322" /LENGTH=90 /DNA_ID=CAMNT_0051572481 /DNA_START=1 /DNA_END=271 /DNA_ORIENTATION=+